MTGRAQAAALGVPSLLLTVVVPLALSQLHQTGPCWKDPWAQQEKHSQCKIFHKFSADT